MNCIKEMEAKILKMTAVIACVLAIASLFINSYLAVGVVAGFLWEFFISRC